MFQHLRFYLILLILNGFLQTSSADTKILSSISIFPHEESHRNEKIYLDNDQHLVVEGTYNEHYEIPADPNNRLTVTVVYVADKNGYKAKYVIVKKPYQRPSHLSPSTLKSTVG